MKVENMTSKICCGCTACLNICPVNAISMRTDIEGFEVPVIDEEKCVKCGLCGKVCSALSAEISRNDLKGAYGAYSENDTWRARSSSGAIFPAFAEKFLDLEGYVCGCILDPKDMRIKHIVTNDIDMIKRMSDSKYVQSSMGKCYSQIGTLLKEDKYVLFTGTSCQVNGLNSYLNNKKIETEKLVTIDIICHGVPSPLIYKEYLEFYEAETGKAVTDMNFRTKLYGWNIGDICFISSLKHNDNSDTSSFVARLWQNCLFSDMCLREYCYTCPYANVNKPSDITIGDFWGVDECIPKFNDRKGCSLVLVHTDKGMHFFEKLDMKKETVLHVEDAIKYQTNLREPSQRPENRDEFWYDYLENGFSHVAKEYLCYTRINKVKYFLKRLLFKMHLRRLSNKISKGILL